MSKSYLAINILGQIFHPENFNINTMNKIYSFPLIKKHYQISFVELKAGIELSEAKFFSYLEQLEYQLGCLNNSFEIKENYDYFLADNILDGYYEAGTDTNIFWEDEKEYGNIKLIVYPSFFREGGFATTDTSVFLAEYIIPSSVYSKFKAFSALSS